jgi:ribonuclease P protein component
VSKRAVPRAVDRNRVKRVVRDAFRRHRSMMPAGVEMVLVAKAGAHTISAGTFLGEWSAALPAMRRAGERIHRR